MKRNNKINIFKVIDFTKLKIKIIFIIIKYRLKN